MSRRWHRKIVSDLASAFEGPLIENSWRGHYVERLVCCHLGEEWRVVSGDWAPYDLQSSDGTKIEVKQSAAKQTWDGTAEASYRRPSFSIRIPKGYYEGSVWVERHGRVADFYVFAWHDRVGDDADHTDEEQWEFFVVAADSLPKQSSIGLDPLRKLTDPIKATELCHALRARMAQGETP